MGMAPVSGRTMYENDRNYGGNENGRNSQKSNSRSELRNQPQRHPKSNNRAIEEDLKAAFEDCSLYRAWTSKMILARLEKRDGIHYDNVEEAMEHMLKDGITDVIVQPTHVMNGVENDLMKEDVLTYAGQFQSVTFGTPLLTTEEDQ